MIKKNQKIVRHCQAFEAYLRHPYKALRTQAESVTLAIC